MQRNASSTGFCRSFLGTLQGIHTGGLRWPSPITRKNTVFAPAPPTVSTNKNAVAPTPYNPNFLADGDRGAYPNHGRIFSPHGHRRVNFSSPAKPWSTVLRCPHCSIWVPSLYPTRSHHVGDNVDSSRGWESRQQQTGHNFHFSWFMPLNQCGCS